MKRKILIIFCTLVFFALIAMTAGNVGAKSLYVNRDLNANSPISAYDIQGPPNYLVWQQTSVPTHYGGVGLAIDTDSEMLFVTFEGYGTIDIVYANNLSIAGQVTAPNANNLAGIIVDQDKQKMYMVDRDTNHLYVYSWDPTNITLTNDITSSPYYVALPGVSSGLHGIALDETNDLLYVGDLTTTVKYFNTADWSAAGNFVVSQSVMGIALDVTNGFVYTGNAYPGYGSIHLLSKYDMNTGNETTLNIGSSDNVVGLAVDPLTSLLYITTGDQGSGGTDQIQVYDSGLNLLYNTGDIGNPTGIAIPGKDISYNPLNLGKDDGLEEDGCVGAGGTITYTISFDNIQNPQSVNNVTITDSLPAETIFTSATGSGIYNSTHHTVTWNIGTLVAGAPQASVNLVAQVNSGTPQGSTIINYCTIDSDETPPTTQSETTDVCESNDTTPPVTIKTVGEPKHGPNDEWVTSSTEFNMTATDNESGVDATYYRIWYNGIWTNWTEYTGNFTLTGDCKHYIEFYSVDNAGNQEQIQNQTHYVDNTPPITDPSPPEFGGPYTTTEYSGTEFIMINCSTPMWINVTDPGCGIGVYRLRYSIWNNETAPGEYIKIPGSDTTVYDGGDGDLDGIVNGNISVMLTFDEGCFHEVRWDAQDLFGHIAYYDYDFAVDCTPPNITKFVGDPWYPSNSGEFVSWVNFNTPFIFNATDSGCNGGAGVARIGYEVRRWNYSTESWDIIRTVIIEDNMTGDEWDTYGEIQNITYMTEECLHEISYWAEDYVGNRVDIKQKHKVDNTPPETIKEIGEPKYYDQSEDITYVTTQTPIWLNTTDHTEPCAVGCEYLHWEIWWKNEAGQWELEEWDDEYDNQVELYFLEECEHMIVWWAVDYLGNKEDAHVQYHKVDDTPPQTPKEIGEPKYGEGDMWVTTQTPIWLNTTDYTEPCAVGCEYLHWEIWWLNASGMWELKDWDDEYDNQAELYFTEECEHKIVWWAVDYLGNKEETNEQIHKVDDTPPDIEKTVGTPQYTVGLPPGEYFVTSNTPIWINATDNGTDPCIVGSVTLTVTVDYQGVQTQYHTVYVEDGTASIGPIFLLGDCIHYVNVTAIDNLGNTKYHNEIFYVDNTPPQTPKEIGEPKYGEGDMWVTTQTPIWLNTTDYAEPCAVGCEYLYWEIWWYNESLELWELKDWDYEYDNQAELYFDEECQHVIIWGAVDYLGNVEDQYMQLHMVDDTPPDIEKTVGTPQYTVGLPPGEYFVTSNTPIWINATDNGTDPCIVGSVNLTVTVDYQGVQTQHHTTYVEYGTASIGPIFLLGDCIHYVNVTAIDNLGNTKYHNEIFYVDNTPPESVKTFDGPTYPEDLNENGTIEPEEQHYWVTSETEITITAIDQADPCAVGVAGFHVTIWWDSDCDDIVDTLLFDDDIIDPYSFNFTFKELQEDYGNYGYIEGLYKIGWNSTDHLGNEETWTEQYHKVDDTPPHIIVIKPVDGWYKDGSGIPSVVFAEDLTNPHGPCGLFDDGAVGIEDGRQGGGFLIDIFPSFNIIPLEGSNFTYDAASHEFIGNLVIPDPSGIPDGAVLFVANGSDNLGNGANSLLEILHAFFIQCAGDPGIFGDLIADFIADQNIVWIGIDNTSPSVDITEPEDGDEIGPNTVYITASMSDILSGITPGAPCYVTLDGISLGMLPYNGAGCQGTLPIPGQMPSGEDLPLEVSVYDNAGNEGSDVVLVDLNNQPPGSPTCAIINPANGTTHEGTIHVVIDAHDGETIEDDLIVKVKTSRQYDPDFIYAATYDSIGGYFHVDIDISKYTDGAKIILQASATDEDNNTALSTWVECWVESTIVYDQWLTEGWNILTLPPGTIACDNSLEKALFSIYSDFDIAFYYDVPTDNWDSWVKDRPAMFNDLTEIYSGKTYFINITKAGGIRFYCDIYPPIVIIDDPEDGSVIEGMGNANIFAYDNESWITDVYVEIYDQNDSLYYNGSGWQPGQIWLSCNYTGGDEWTYDTDGIWTDDHIYTLTAMAYDAGGCTGVDSSTFTIQPED